MVDREVMHKIIYRIQRNLDISSCWIIHMMMIGVHSIIVLFWTGIVVKFHC